MKLQMYFHSDTLMFHLTKKNNNNKIKAHTEQELQNGTYGLVMVAKVKSFNIVTKIAQFMKLLNNRSVILG